MLLALHHPFLNSPLGFRVFLFCFFFCVFFFFTLEYENLLCICNVSVQSPTAVREKKDETPPSVLSVPGERVPGSAGGITKDRTLLQ